MKYKAVISDAGEVLFSTKLQRDKKEEIIQELLFRTNISIDDALKKFKPYNDLAQTTHSLWEAILLFSQNEIGKNISPEYAKSLAYGLFPKKNELFDGVEETLRWLKKKGLPFIILTNSPFKGEAHTEKMDENIQGLIYTQISSKDIRSRKPDFMTFRSAYHAAGISNPLESILYLAHSQPEIFGAADFGFQTVVCNYQQQKDAQEIANRIKQYNEDSSQKILEILQFKDLVGLLK